MFHKVHIRLTLLFMIVTACIIAVLSTCYLYVAEKGLYNNSKFSFDNDMNTIIGNFEQQKVITYSNLSRLEKNGRYTIAISDHGSMLSFSQTHENEGMQEIINDFIAYHTAQLTEEESNTFSTTYETFSYQAKDHTNYFACVASLWRNQKSIKIYILYGLNGLERQIFIQRMVFLGLNLFALVLLSIFAWSYTGHLLRPIEENQKKQNQFVASASHELRTPLAIILSSISALQKAEKEEDKKHFFHAIKTSSKRMSKLIDDMLTLAGADNHTWQMRFEETELDTLMLNCYEAFEAMALEKKLSFHIELPDESIPTCMCDNTRIEQVITILLHNAFSYCGDQGKVTLSLQYQNDAFVIKTSDNGPGIAPEDKPHVFERFYRCTKCDGKQEHFGLGLCIAKEIISSHHGLIKVSDTPGGGTTFTITLKRTL